MIYALIPIVTILIFLGPQWWVKYVLNKHHKHMEGMPGTGEELAKHLLEKYELGEVSVKQGDKGEDYYSPDENFVCLSPEVFNGKSLTAVAVAAHEVGHALQFNRKEPVSLLRGKYLAKARKIQHYGVMLLIGMPLIGVMFTVPHLSIMLGMLGLITMLASVLMYVAILPEEFDASFNKALPILEKGGYVPLIYMPSIRTILQACALTYVAAALADILRLWRWLAILR